MSGAWKRMIRSVRRVLSSLTNDRVLTGDQLETFLLEAESIVNSRPLTPVTMDTDGETPLTPIHLLRVNASFGLPPTRTDENDSYARRSWRHVQYLVSRFSKRFAWDYLRTVIARPKWCQKEGNPEVGDIVLVSCNWKRFVSFPVASAKGLLRFSRMNMALYGHAVVKLKDREYKWSVHKLCLIEWSNVSV